MKKLLLLLALPFAFITALSAQITQSQSDSIVLNRLSSETKDYTLYAKEGIQTGITIATAAGEALELDYPCWVYYVTLDFGRYLIVKESNGNLLEINPKKNTVPDDLAEWREVTEEIQPLCEFENPVTDLLWLKEIIEQFEEDAETAGHNPHARIYQCAYRDGIGFLLEMCVGCPDTGYSFRNCEGAVLCAGEQLDENSCSEFEIDLGNKELIWEMEEKPIIEPCVFENPLTDLPWLKEIIEQFEEDAETLGHNPHARIYQCSYKDGIGFLLEMCVGCTDTGYSFRSCEGGILCAGEQLDENSCSEFEIDLGSKELVWEMEEIIKVNYPIEVPFTEYSLIDTSFLCLWTTNLLHTNNKLIIVNSNEELGSYINCLEGDYPEIDFSKHTLLLAKGNTPTLVSEVSKHLLQFSVDKYKLDIGVRVSDATQPGTWIIALIISKISKDAQIELNVTIYPKDIPFSKYSLEGTSCQWIDYNEATPEFIRIDNSEDLKNYINCTDGIYPEIDFSIHTLLLIRGFTTDDASKMLIYFGQFFSKKYRLTVSMYRTSIDKAVPWTIALIINKLSDDIEFVITR